MEPIATCLRDFTTFTHSHTECREKSIRHAFRRCVLLSIALVVGVVGVCAAQSVTGINPSRLLLAESSKNIDIVPSMAGRPERRYKRSKKVLKAHPS